MPEPTRFPPPWTAVEGPEAYWIEDAQGHRFGYTYFDDQPQRGGVIKSNRFTKDEARRLVVNFAKLPDLLKGST